METKLTKTVKSLSNIEIEQLARTVERLKNDEVIEINWKNRLYLIKNVIDSKGNKNISVIIYDDVKNLDEAIEKYSYNGNYDDTHDFFIAEDKDDFMSCITEDNLFT